MYLRRNTHGQLPPLLPCSGPRLHSHLCILKSMAAVVKIFGRNPHTNNLPFISPWPCQASVLLFVFDASSTRGDLLPGAGHLKATEFLGHSTIGTRQMRPYHLAGCKGVLRNVKGPKSHPHKSSMQRT